MIRKIAWILAIISAIAMVYCTATLLPDIVPTHFNFAGEADQWGSKWMYAFFGVIPLIVLSVYEIIRRKAPDHPNRKMEEKLVPVIALVFIPLMWFLIPLQKDAARLGPSFMCAVTGLLGALFIFMGNYMGKVSRNRHLGLRIYWTLKSDIVWNKTHRLQGFTAVIGGIIMIACSIIGAFAGKQAHYWCGAALAAGLLLSVVIPTLYSWLLYHQLKKEGKL